MPLWRVLQACVLNKPYSDRQHHVIPLHTLTLLMRCRVIVKLGPRFDMGPLLPRQADGWNPATEGYDFAVWERPG